MAALITTYWQRERFYVTASVQMRHRWSHRISRAIYWIAGQDGTSLRRRAKSCRLRRFQNAPLSARQAEATKMLPTGYAFTLPEYVARGELSPLRDPKTAEPDDESRNPYVGFYSVATQNSRARLGTAALVRQMHCLLRGEAVQQRRQTSRLGHLLADPDANGEGRVLQEKG